MKLTSRIDMRFVLSYVFIYNQKKNVLHHVYLTKSFKKNMFSTRIYRKKTIEFQ